MKIDVGTVQYVRLGIRVGSTNKVEIDDDANPATPLVTTSHTETSYLVDHFNHTGYSQVLEEVLRQADTQAIIRKIIDTLGLDVIGQSRTDYSAGIPGLPGIPSRS